MVDNGTRRDHARLNQDDVAVLAHYGAAARWPAGFSIYESGSTADGIFIVLRGEVVLRSRVKAGRGFVPAIVTPGGTFGAEGLFEGGHYRTDARAECEAETLHLSAPHFRALVRERPQHAFSLLGQILSERSELLQRLGELAALSVEQRLVNAVLRLSVARAARDYVIEIAPTAGRGTIRAHRSGARNGDAAGSGADPHSQPLELDANRYRLLCEMVGATRESVSLVVARLVAEGSAERDGAGGAIRVPSPRALLRRGRGARERARSIKVEREPELTP